MNGKDGFWMEWTNSGASTGPMGNMTMKVLIVPGDTSATPRVIMQMPGRPPMEMPSQMGRPGGQAPRVQPSDIRSTAEDVGSESITVPAGTFHLRTLPGEGRLWRYLGKPNGIPDGHREASGEGFNHGADQSSHGREG